MTLPKIQSLRLAAVLENCSDKLDVLSNTLRLPPGRERYSGADRVRPHVRLSTVWMNMWSTLVCSVFRRRPGWANWGKTGEHWRLTTVLIRFVSLLLVFSWLNVNPSFWSHSMQQMIFKMHVELEQKQDFTSLLLQEQLEKERKLEREEALRKRNEAKQRWFHYCH